MPSRDMFGTRRMKDNGPSSQTGTGFSRAPGGAISEQVKNGRKIRRPRKDRVIRQRTKIFEPGISVGRTQSPTMQGANIWQVRDTRKDKGWQGITQRLGSHTTPQAMSEGIWTPTTDTEGLTIAVPILGMFVCEGCTVQVSTDNPLVIVRQKFKVRPGGRSIDRGEHGK